MVDSSVVMEVLVWVTSLVTGLWTTGVAGGRRGLGCSGLELPPPSSSCCRRLLSRRFWSTGSTTRVLTVSTL